MSNQVHKEHCLEMKEKSKKQKDRKLQQPQQLTASMA